MDFSEDNLSNPNIPWRKRAVLWAKRHVQGTQGTQDTQSRPVNKPDKTITYDWAGLLKFEIAKGHKVLSRNLLDHEFTVVFDNAQDAENKQPIVRWIKNFSGKIGDPKEKAVYFFISEADAHEHADDLTDVVLGKITFRELLEFAQRRGFNVNFLFHHTATDDVECDIPEYVRIPSVRVNELFRTSFHSQLGTPLPYRHGQERFYYKEDCTSEQLSALYDLAEQNRWIAPGGFSVQLEKVDSVLNIVMEILPCEGLHLEEIEAFTSEFMRDASREMMSIDPFGEMIQEQIGRLKIRILDHQGIAFDAALERELSSDLGIDRD